MPTRLFYLLGFLGWFGFGSSTTTKDTSDTAQNTDTGDTGDTGDTAEIADEIIEVIPPPPPPEPAPPLFEDRTRPLLLHSTPENVAGIDHYNCVSCHSDITEQWTSSAHSKATRNTIYKEKVSEYANSPLCTQCHAPLQIQHHQLASSYVDGDPLKPIFSDNPNWDAVLASESVGCASCHIRDGKILGIEEHTNAPHEVIVSQELSSSQACVGCHQFSSDLLPFPMYDTFNEWQESPQAKANIQCQDCHMPPQATSNAFATPLQSSHHFSQTSTQALSVRVELTSPILKRATEIPLHVELINVGAGHSFPTGNPWKQYILELSITDAKGKKLITPQEHIIGRIQNKDEEWGEDLRIPAGGSRHFDFQINISSRKRSGSALLRLSLKREGKEDTTIWDLPVDVY